MWKRVSSYNVKETQCPCVLVRTLWKAKEAKSLLNKKIIKEKEDEDEDGEIEEDANIQPIARVSQGYEYGIGVHRRGGGGRGKE